MLKNIIVFITLLIVFTSCSPNNKIAVPDPLQRQWMLKTLPGITYDELVSARADINLSNLQQPGAYGGCNRIFFSLERGKDNSFNFKNIGATKMYCDKTMHVEDTLVKALQQIRKYKVDGHQIVFSNASGEIIATAVAADWD